MERERRGQKKRRDREVLNRAKEREEQETREEGKKSIGKSDRKNSSTADDVISAFTTY